MPKYLVASDILIAPFNTERFKLIEKYGFWWCPVKLFEYLAMGKPILTYEYPEVKNKELCDSLNFANFFSTSLNNSNSPPNSLLAPLPTGKLLIFFMISYLKGKVLLKNTDYIILETNQVGYKVFVPEILYMQLREGQEGVEIFCSLQIRKDDTLELYGLPSFDALNLFEAFRDVSGIGPKAATLLSSLGDPDKIRKAIDDRNVDFFRGVKGIGEKKVQKLILELTGKLGSLEKDNKRSTGDEVVDSLAALGFSKTEAKDALSQLPADITDTEQKIKAALYLLGRK